MDLEIQKASMYKRISAFLFDIIMLAVLITGTGFLLSSALGYDGYLDRLNAYYDEYEQEYGVKFEITQQDYQQMPAEKQQAFDDAYDALIADQDVLKTYSMVVNLTLVISSLSILIGYLILEFAVPLWLKNGQTLGKKIFGIAVMHTECIQITPMLLFIRTILGKYTLETMVPVLILVMIFFNTIGLTGTIILGLLLLVQIILVIATPTNSFLHDILAKTVVVDFASQRIFKNGAELLEYKKELHAEQAARQEY